MEKKTAFNLLDEPWIRVMDARCRMEEVSLKEALINAHKYAALCGEMPTQDVAILRLLLAVLHTVFSRVDVQGNPHRIKNENEAVELWRSLWENGKLPEEPICKYLEEMRERFWLFHPERPFAQIAEPRGTSFPSAKLNSEVSESNNDKTMKLFCSYSGKEKEELSYAQAARWLIHLISVDDNALKSSEEGKEESPTGKVGSAGKGWFGRIGLTVLKGENLFQTLLFNLVLVNRKKYYQPERPLWEREKITLEEAKKITELDNLAELYTLPVRKINLKEKDGKVTDYSEIKGEYISKEEIGSLGLLEPMTAWKKEKESNIVPVMHEFNRQMWQDFSALLSETEKEGYRPQVVNWYNILLSDDELSKTLPEIVRMEVLGIDYNQKGSAITNVFSDSLDLHAKILSEHGAGIRARIQDEIMRCEKLAMAIGDLAEQLYFANGGKKESKESKKSKKSEESKESKESKVKGSAQKQLYYRLDIPFREWLRTIKLDEDGYAEEDVYDEWQKKAKQIACAYARELCDQVNSTAMRGHKLEKKLYSAPKAMLNFYEKVNGIYEKVRR